MTIKEQEIVDEVNALSLLLDRRLSESGGDKTKQLVAVGVLFYLWMQANPKESQTSYINIIHSIASRLKETIDMGPGAGKTQWWETK